MAKTATPTTGRVAHCQAPGLFASGPGPQSGSSATSLQKAKKLTVSYSLQDPLLLVTIASSAKLMKPLLRDLLIRDFAAAAWVTGCRPRLAACTRHCSRHNGSRPGWSIQGIRLSLVDHLAGLHQCPKSLWDMEATSLNPESYRHPVPKNTPGRNKAAWQVLQALSGPVVHEGPT